MVAATQPREDDVQQAVDPDAPERMNVFDAYDVDQELIDDGLSVKVYFSATYIGTVKCRPTDTAINHDWRRAQLRMAKKVQAYMAEHNVTELPHDLDVRILAEAYAESIVTGWDVLGPNDTPLPFDDITVVNTFCRLPKFFKAIRDKAAVWTNYRVKYEDDTVKD